jgi:hypothetical protein
MTRAGSFAIAALVGTVSASYTCGVGHYINQDPLAGWNDMGTKRISLKDCGDGSTDKDCKCRRCPANFVSDGSVATCAECPSEYRPNPEQSQCIACTWSECAAGTYNSVRTYNTHAFCGSQQCLPCPAGLYMPTATTGETSCHACPQGKTSTDGKTCGGELPLPDAPVDSVHNILNPAHPSEKLCSHTKCFIEMGRHGQITLRSHHHTAEAHGTSVRCSIVHPANLQPAFCRCSCFTAATPFGSHANNPYRVGFKKTQTLDHSRA